MSTFDGDDFIKTDDDALGTGTNTDTYPVDVFTEQRFSSNQRYIATGLDGAALNYEIDIGSTYNFDSDQYRPFCTFQKATFLKIPWYLQNGHNAVNVGGGYSVRNAVGFGPFQKNVSGTMEILQNNQVIASQDVTFANTWKPTVAEPSDLADYNFTISFDEFNDNSQWGEFRFWMQSYSLQQSGAFSPDYTGLNEPYRQFRVTNDQAATGQTWSIPSNGPGSGSWVNKALAIDVDSYNPVDGFLYEQVVDLISADFSDTVQQIYTYPSNLSSPVEALQVDLSMLHLRYLQMEPKYNKNALNTPLKEEQKAQEPIRGRTSVNMPNSLIRQHQRLSLIGIGPEGNTDNQDEQWSSGYRRIWKSVASGSSGALIDHPVSINKTNSSIYVAFYAICWQSTPYDTVGEANMTFDVELNQLSNGDSSWTTAKGTPVNSDSIEYPMAVWPAQSDEYYSPMLIGLATSTVTEWPLFKDGLIYDIDQNKPTLVVLKLDISGADYDLPARVRVTPSFEIVEYPEPPADDPDSVKTTYLTCVGYSIWEGGNV